MNYGLGTWTRTKINGFKGRCATDCTIPNPFNGPGCFLEVHSLLHRFVLTSFEPTL